MGIFETVKSIKACLVGLLPGSGSSRRAYQTFCSRSHFSVKNRGPGAGLEWLLQNGSGSSGGAVPNRS